jgi:hypothetical protein
VKKDLTTEDTEGHGGSDDAADNAFFEARDIEVYQEADAKV